VAWLPARTTLVRVAATRWMVEMCQLQGTHMCELAA
jgi:hypothetical protein